MSELILRCEADPRDTLDVLGNDTVQDRPVVQIFARQKNDNTEICLNEQDARTLFNWLGVWLHGGNRD